MQTGQITVTSDGRGIVGWLDGATAARIIWKHEDEDDHVHGRECDTAGLALAVLHSVGFSRYQLVSAELVPVVTTADLMAAIAPDYRAVVLAETKIQTLRCMCADELLYTVTADPPDDTTPFISLTSNLVPVAVGMLQEQSPAAEITAEPFPNPDYRPDCQRDIVEDEAYLKYAGADKNPRRDNVYCKLCGVALWGHS
jgi:hypothetical protein